MSIDIRLPNINGKSDREQLAQVRSYLYQLAEQLQFALNTLEISTGNAVVSQPKPIASAKIDEAATFNAIKSLIIKSADIVDAYSDTISKRLGGEYVATSDFGTFKEKTAQDIAANATSIESMYSNIQEILSDIQNLESTLISVNAYIRSGLLYTDDSGVPIYGVEIGQKNKVDGVEVFSKYAQFTSDRLSFFDSNDIEVAYISDYKLYITHVVITGTLTGNSFRMDFTKGFRLKYVGRG